MGEQLGRAVLLEEQPRRGPGRPSKRQLRERARAERLAVKAEQASEKPPRGRPKTTRNYTRQKPFVLQEPASDSLAYCPKCRERRTLKYPRQATLSNGRQALRGRCTICKTMVVRIMRVETAGEPPSAFMPNESHAPQQRDGRALARNCHGRWRLFTVVRSFSAPPPG